MRSSALILITGIFTILAIDGLLYYQLRHQLRKKWQKGIYFFHTLFFISLLFLFQYFIIRLKGPQGYFWIEKIIGITFLFYVPKLVFIVFHGFGSLFRHSGIRITRFFS